MKQCDVGSCSCTPLTGCQGFDPLISDIMCKIMDVKRDSVLSWAEEVDKIMYKLPAKDLEQLTILFGTALIGKMCRRE